ncbi:MAG: 4-(cytidine 5'-diphospho)-2-C-methyl-D-erythritol kinase [Gaiellaceae bacterium]
MTATIAAPAKINLALVVGARREDGKHEVVTVYERIALADTLTLEPANDLEIEGFPADTLVALALTSLAAAAEVEPNWRVAIEKRIPVGAGLGGGSSDAAAAMRLANASLAEPFDALRLHELAAALGADVPLFLTSGPQLGEGDGTDLTPLELPRDYAVLVLLPYGATKHSTKAVYDAFDDRHGEVGFAQRREELVGRLGDISSLTDIAAWPRNDLAYSPLTAELERLGAVRADVSGAGPALYGLFESEADARRAATVLADRGAAWVVFPAWYG